jgi:uncharacterized protein
MADLAQPQKGIIPPPIDRDSEGFWAGLREDQIRLPHCLSCGNLWFPPTPGCPICGATEFETVVASPRGRIYSWVVVHRSLHPEYAEELPYVVATVTLDDGPRVFARLLDVEIDRIEADQPVEAVFYDIGEYRLLGFAPRRGNEGDQRDPERS